MEGELREERKWVRLGRGSTAEGLPPAPKTGSNPGGDVQNPEPSPHREGWGRGGSRVVDPQLRGLPTTLDGEWRKTRLS